MVGVFDSVTPRFGCIESGAFVRTYSHWQSICKNNLPLGVFGQAVAHAWLVINTHRDSRVRAAVQSVCSTSEAESVDLLLRAWRKKKNWAWMGGGREDSREVLRKSMFHILWLYSERWRIAKIREDWQERHSKSTNQVKVESWVFVHLSQANNSQQAQVCKSNIRFMFWDSYKFAQLS